MTLNNFTSGANTDFSDELNENSSVFLTQSGLNLIRQLKDRNVDFSEGQIDGFAEAYTSSTGRKGSVNTSQTSAVFADSTYSTVGFSENYYWILEADNVDENGLETGNITVSKHISENKWLIYVNSTDSDEVKRAIVYERLFGENGIGSYTTNVQNLYTTVSRDIDKRAYFYKVTTFAPKDGDQQEIYADISLSGTTGSNNSIWYKAVRDSDDGDESTSFSIEFPKGLIVEEETYGYDEREVEEETLSSYGTDATNDEVNSPSDAYIYANSFPYGGVDYIDNEQDAEMVLLTEGDASASVTDNGGANGSTSFTGISYEDDYGVSAMQDIPSSFEKSNYLNRIEHDIPTEVVGNNDSIAIGVPLVNKWDSSANIKYRLQNSSGDDSGWLPAMQPKVSSFTQFSSPPETCIVALTPSTEPYDANIANASFENPLSNWSISKDTTDTSIDQEGVFSDMYNGETDGTSSYKISVVGSDFGSVDYTLTLDPSWDASRASTLAVDIAFDNISEVSTDFTIRVLTSQGTLSQTTNISDVNTNGQRTVEVNIPVSYQDSNAGLELNWNMSGDQNGPSGDFWIDNIRVVKEQSLPIIQGFYLKTS